MNAEVGREPQVESGGPFIHIFVYGTLRAGGAAYGLMERCVPVGPVKVTGNKGRAHG